MTPAPVRAARRAANGSATGKRALTVLIADGAQDSRLSLQHSLEARGVAVSGAAEDAESAVAGIVGHRPDIALLDTSLPGDAMRAATEIGRTMPGVSVVMLTSVPSDEELFAALLAGASGYLPRSTDADSLARALQAVAAGEAAVPRASIARLIEQLRRSHHERLWREEVAHPRLTDREWAVLNLMADGLSTAQIAKHLFVSPVTVRSHIAAIVRKLNVENRDAAVRVFVGA